MTGIGSTKEEFIMGKKQEDFVKLLLKDKKLKLEYLHEQHKIAIAVYEAKRQLIMSDIDTLEKQLDNSK
jgi:hypothetical protein